MSAKSTLNAVYKILTKLEEDMDMPNQSFEGIRPEDLGISETRWVAIIEMLLEAGYVKGFKVVRTFGGQSVEVTTGPRLTIKGLEYLVDNSTGAKVLKAAKQIADLIP